MRRLLLPVAAVSLSCVLLAGARAAAAPAGFDPSTAKPYFAEGAAAPARKAFALEKWGEAAKLFDAYVKAHARASDKMEANFLAAYAASRAGEFAVAARRFDELAKAWPLLADYDRVYAARAWLAAKDFAAAAERAAKVDGDSPLDGDARLVRADAAMRGGHADAAAKEYRGYLDKYPKSWRAPEATLHLAQALDAAGKWDEARPLYREAYIRFPTESWAAAAEKRLREKDAAALVLDGGEHVTRGLALFGEMRNEAAEKELQAALADAKLDGKARCTAAYHLAQTVFKERNRPRAAPLFDAAVDICAKAQAPGAPDADPTIADYHMRSLYQGARCHAAKAELDVAEKMFAAAEEAHPAHSFADDARLRRAEMFDALADKARAATPKDDAAVQQDEAEAARMLAEMADKYPMGDMKSEALFRLFFRAWKAGDLASAKKWLEASLAKVPRETGWWDAGRTLYWTGRLAAREGRTADALAAWTRCAKEYPLAYYALASLNRMREVDAAAAKQLAAVLARPAPTAKELAWAFASRPLFAASGFRRGVELARLGLGNEAKREFAAIGIKPDDGHAGARVSDKIDPATEELLWLATVLYDRAGEWALSHWIPRHTLTAYAEAWPVGENKKRWLLSYPEGYRELIVENARKNGQPAALEFAVVREESAFDPLNESFANAIGLTQLTAEPAARFAEGLPHDRAALRDPVINVTIGARELGDLWKRFAGTAPLAIAGYNAGEGAVRRWLRAATGDMKMDEFVESIPYDETRGYTKRVLSSFFAYAWLYGDGEIPALGNDLPKK